jgi:MarR family transcriptional regulator for hemolysin
MGSAVEQDVLTLLSDVARRVRTLADQSARRHGMTWAQLTIVRRLERQPGLSQNELAAVAGVAPITVARLIDRIEALGLVKRHEDPTDHRIWRLQVTPAAASALRDSKCYQAELGELITKGVDSAALDAMIMGLHKMKENLTGRRRIAKAPRLPKQQCPEGSVASRSGGASSRLYSMNGK